MGLAVITESDTAPSATNLALGQFWFDSHNRILYIFDGRYSEPNGTIVTTPTATTVPVWIQLVNASELSTTANVLLAANLVGTRVTSAVPNASFLPPVDPTTLIHQDDLNLYYFDCLVALDDELAKQAIPTSGSPPANPVAGQLWYDNEDLELSIWYVEPGQADADGQWVPTFSTVMQDQAISTLRTGLVAETVARRASDNAFTTTLTNLATTVTDNKGFLQNELDGIRASITAIVTPDLTDYVTCNTHQLDLAGIQSQVDAVIGNTESIINSYSTKQFVFDADTALQADINTRATTTALNAAIASIPSLTGYATETYVTNSIAALPAGITSAGGTVTGKLTLDKADVALPSIDFSTHSYDGKLAQKYRTNTSGSKYATFGTNDNLFEYSWDFTDCEDFCWTHGTNGKVASIDKNGIAAKKLYIADFGKQHNLWPSIIKYNRCRCPSYYLPDCINNTADTSSIGYNP